VVTITETCHLWVPSPGDNLFIYMWRHLQAAAVASDMLSDRR